MLVQQEADILAHTQGVEQRATLWAGSKQVWEAQVGQGGIEGTSQACLRQPLPTQPNPTQPNPTQPNPAQPSPAHNARPPQRVGSAPDPGPTHLEHQPDFELVRGVVIADQPLPRRALDQHLALRQANKQTAARGGRTQAAGQQQCAAWRRALDQHLALRQANTAGQPGQLMVQARPVDAGSVMQQPQLHAECHGLAPRCCCRHRLAGTACSLQQLQGTHPVGLQQAGGQAQRGGLAGAAAADDAHRLAAADLEGGPPQDVLAAGGGRRRQVARAAVAGWLASAATLAVSKPTQSCRHGCHTAERSTRLSKLSAS